MPEYASRGPIATTTMANSSAASYSAMPTPAQRAHDAVSAASRSLGQVQKALETLEAARSANDLARWHEEKTKVDRAMIAAERAVTRTEPQASAADDTDRQAFELTKSEIVAAKALLAFVEPPKGYAVIVEENALLATIHAGADDTAIRALLDQTPGTDLKVLLSRLASPLPQDVLAKAIWNLGAERRREITSFAHNVERRKARELAASVRRSVSHVEAPEPETLDTKLRRAFNSFSPLEAIHSAIATESGDVRQAIADRLRRYRPGNGDDIAARFSTLAKQDRDQILSALSQTPTRDLGHQEKAQALDQAPKSRVAVDETDPLRPFHETLPDDRSSPLPGWMHAAPNAATIDFAVRYV
ncbi:MAG TPA: hypothetical protein VGC41_20120, partial [Kofleriaceae bacterium]